MKAFKLICTLGTLLVVVALLAGNASAQMEMPRAYGASQWPQALANRPLTLGMGMMEIRGNILANLSKDNELEPVSIAPDIYFGLTDYLNIGVVHGTGICITGEDNGCKEVYDDVGLDVILAIFRSANTDVAARTTFAAGTVDPIFQGFFSKPGFDPFTLSVMPGLMFKWTTGSLAVELDPTVSIGLTERNGGGLSQNKEFLSVPLEVQYQILPQFAVFALSGFAAPLNFDNFDLGDSYAIPVGLGVLYALSNRLDVGAQFIFPNLAGKELFGDLGPDRLDSRFVYLNVNYRIGGRR